MNTDLEDFVVKMLRFILIALLPVVATAFLTIPMNLGGHPGEEPIASAQGRHMT